MKGFIDWCWYFFWSAIALILVISITALVVVFAWSEVLERV